MWRNIAGVVKTAGWSHDRRPPRRHSPPPSGSACAEELLPGSGDDRDPQLRGVHDPARGEVDRIRLGAIEGHLDHPAFAPDPITSLMLLPPLFESVRRARARPMVPCEPVLLPSTPRQAPAALLMMQSPAFGWAHQARPRPGRAHGP